MVLFSMVLLDIKGKLYFCSRFFRNPLARIFPLFIILNAYIKDKLTEAALTFAQLRKVRYGDMRYYRDLITKIKNESSQSTELGLDEPNVINN